MDGRQDVCVEKSERSTLTSGTVRRMSKYTVGSEDVAAVVMCRNCALQRLLLEIMAVE